MVTVRRLCAAEEDLVVAAACGRVVARGNQYRQALQDTQARQASCLCGTGSNRPHICVQYLTRDYLSRGLTVAERASCFVHHYSRLQAKLPESFLRQMLHRDITFVEIREGDRSFGITMGLSRPHDKEGEFSLNLLVGGEMVFVLSFTIVPGRVVRSKTADVLLINDYRASRDTIARYLLPPPRPCTTWRLPRCCWLRCRGQRRRSALVKWLDIRHRSKCLLWTLRFGVQECL